MDACDLAVLAIIERLAKEAGLIAVNPKFTQGPPIEQLAKFAALIAEECAKECEEQADSSRELGNTQAMLAADECAAAIRAKFALSHKTPEAK